MSLGILSHIIFLCYSGSYSKIYSFCSRSSVLPRLFLILSILWTVAILCYSAQFWSGLQKSSHQTGLWLFKTADPVFGWSLSTPTSVIDIISLGKYLEILLCNIHSGIHNFYLNTKYTINNCLI